MSDKVRIFEHEKFGKVRTLIIDDTAWFVGNDICEALGYARPRNAIKKYVDGDDALKWGVIDSLGRNQKTKRYEQKNVLKIFNYDFLPVWILLQPLSI